MSRQVVSAVVVGLLLAVLAVAPAYGLGQPWYGVILNGSSPWILINGDGNTYKLVWYGGWSFFNKGDVVLITGTSGFASMVGMKGVNKDKTAKVWVSQDD